MKKEKIVVIIGLSIMIILGIVIMINILISDQVNPLTPYEFWIGIGMVVFGSIFLWKVMQKPRKRIK